MEGKYLISVLVPMYNTEKYIGRCIESILNQSYKNIELILVDDGSTDHTYEIAKKYADSDARIRLFQKPNEKNVSKTRNFLLDKIQGKFFTFVDSDDYLEPLFIETLYRYIHKEHAAVAMCSYKIQLFKSKIHQKREDKIKEITEDGIKDLEDITFSSFPSSFMLWNKLYRTQVLNDIKFNEECRYGEDFSFIIYFFSHAHKVVTIDQSLYHYMIRPGSEMRAKYGSKHMSFVKFLEEQAKNSTDENVKRTCQIWLPITAASTLFMAMRTNQKHKNQEDIEYLKKLVLDNKDAVLKDKKVDKTYKAFLRLTTAVCKL